MSLSFLTGGSSGSTPISLGRERPSLSGLPLEDPVTEFMFILALETKMFMLEEGKSSVLVAN